LSLLLGFPSTQSSSNVSHQQNTNLNNPKTNHHFDSDTTSEQQEDDMLGQHYHTHQLEQINENVQQSFQENKQQKRPPLSVQTGKNN
jgi:hypothetical protein